MAAIFRTQNSILYPIERAAREVKSIVEFALVALVLLSAVLPSAAQVAPEFHRTLTVTLAEPVAIDVEISNGDLELVYGRDGQVSISGIAKAPADTKLDDNFFSEGLTVEQRGNHLTIRHAPDPTSPGARVSVLYRIDVPYRTEVITKLNRGNQIISGILGPVKAVSNSGDIKASYVSQGLQAQVDKGNLDIQVIGERVEATVGRGNISCTRVPQGVSAETGDGDITLMVVGPSTAVVKNGSGRIDVGGARGSLTSSTIAGDLHIKAVPHDDWQLSSVSGNVRLEFPPVAKLELEASTMGGEFDIDRDDIAKPGADIHHFQQAVNGGGKRIAVHTGTGRIVIR